MLCKEWVKIMQSKASGKPSVISMSLSGGSFQSMDDAIRNAQSRVSVGVASIISFLGSILHTMAPTRLRREQDISPSRC